MKTVITRAVLWVIAVSILCIPTYLINPETLGVLYVVTVITGIASFSLISIKFKFIDKQVKKAIRSYLAEKEKKEKELKIELMENEKEQNILRIKKDKKLKIEIKKHHKEKKLKLKKKI